MRRLAEWFVPESLRACVLRMYHNTQLAAHQGKNRTLKQITESVYWPGMKADITPLGQSMLGMHQDARLRDQCELA